MHQLEGIVRAEREHAGDQLVERDSERVEICPPIERTIHASRLLGRHVGQGSFQALAPPGPPILQRQVGGRGELDQPNRARAGVTKEVVRSDVLVDDVMSVHGLDRLGHGDGHVEEARQGEGYRADQVVERLLAHVLQNQGDPLVEALHAECPHHPRRVDGAQHGVLVPKARDLRAA